MHYFRSTDEEYLDDAKKFIKESMRKIVHQMKITRQRGYDPEEILKDTHKLMDDLFYGKCDENWFPIKDLTEANMPILEATRLK